MYRKKKCSEKRALQYDAREQEECSAKEIQSDSRRAFPFLLCENDSVMAAINHGARSQSSVAHYFTFNSSSNALSRSLSPGRRAMP